MDSYRYRGTFSYCCIITNCCRIDTDTIYNLIHTFIRSTLTSTLVSSLLSTEIDSEYSPLSSFFHQPLSGGFKEVSAFNLSDLKLLVDVCAILAPSLSDDSISSYLLF